MTEVDTSILDELRGRQRRAALRERGASTGRVVTSAPRPLGRRRPKPRVRPKAKGPGINSQTAKANARASIEARRQREGDVIADALLAICTRLAQDRKVL